MLLKCIVLFLFCIVINAEYYHQYYDRCEYPHLENGMARVKQRMSFVKFTCRARYTLMGNKYATCRNGQWDVPIPICVKSGCDPIEEVNNAIVQAYHNNAWMLFFCLPEYKLEGSPVIYCDGRRWNATAPKCVDSSQQTKTSCDFEEPDLCGWKQDELHDFDWRRLNKKTPSSFLLTGPQYDHTYGVNGKGYYMYIESTSRLANDTARLISPVFEHKLANDGCFVFYYHMYGRSIGGLRVYQKPDKLNMYDVLHDSTNGTNQYLLFEQWGNQGNYWYSGVSPLIDVGDDFQIIIEGIRGRSFMSDIAIDDVGIFQGENCTNAKLKGSTAPSINDESCVDRCGLQSSPSKSTCDCSIMCVVYDNCCPDYLDVCEFGTNVYNSSEADTSPSFTSTTMQVPQTQKLVRNITATPLTPTSTYRTTRRISSTTSSTSSTTSRKTPTTPKPRPKPTLKSTPSTKFTTTTSTGKPTVAYVTTTARPTAKVTKYIKWNRTTTLSVVDKTSSTATTKKPATTKRFNFNLTVKPPTRPKQLVVEKSGVSKAVLTSVIVIAVIALSIGGLYFGSRMRGARGAWGVAHVARLRARASRDPEVRFLKADDDVDADDE